MRPFSLREHISDYFDFSEVINPPDILFKKRRTDGLCAMFRIEEGRIGITTSYYVGADWIPNHEGDHWVYVESKLNTKFDTETGEEKDPQEEKELVKVDVLKMLFQALEEPDVRDHTEELFEIKFDSPWISLQKNQDLISPLIMIQFLNQVKDIVRKGLKKSYYKVERNLYAKVKGKVLVSQTIKQNLVKNKNLNTFCQYEQFGTDGLENRLLKKTLTFIKRYLGNYKSLGSDAYLEETFNFIQPAFEGVSEEVQLHEIKHFKFNPFYKNYEKAIELAKLILQRFSYNLNSIQDQETILTPPYWIDMSKLFELYVLGLLKKKYGSQVQYHEQTHGNELDFLFYDNENSLVIDAKYKPGYIGKSHQGLHADIRQVSGYARLRKIRERLRISNRDLLLGCVIIYPDLNLKSKELGNLTNDEVKQYEKAWKVGVKLPIYKLEKERM
jgi:5-methylcytosine-specific restriction enzyme subunit McrC